MRHKNISLFFLISTSLLHTNALAQDKQITFNQLAQQCARSVHYDTLQAIARVESGFNPYAIGVVKGSLKHQPRTHAEAVATAKALHAQGKNFSMGLMQVNRYNLAKYGLTYETVFEACNNINAGAQILQDCFNRAGGDGQNTLHKAFSCYYSGNFRFGFKRDFQGQPSYVQKVVNAASQNSPYTIIRVPAVQANVPIVVPNKKTVHQETFRQLESQKQLPETYFAPKEIANYSSPQKRIENWDVFTEFHDKKPEWDVFR